MSTKQKKIENFDPSQPGLSDATIFGLPFTAQESEIIIVPAPWEVTVSYGSGTSEGPDAVLEASYQIDLLHQEFPELWKLGVFMDTAPELWAEKSQELKGLAQPIIEALENGEDVESFPVLQSDLDKINKGCKVFNSEVKDRINHWLNKGKRVILLGGDHSTPLGYYQALSEKYDSFGILHFDAHMDLRKAYEGFTYSHASIMYNALELSSVEKIVQVGIRDFSQAETDTVSASNNRVKVYTDTDLKAKAFEGVSWKAQCEQILSHLPENVVVSFDIDALQRWYCPNTGTPVPGGLSFEEATFLLNLLANSERKIIGMDLVEVAPGDDDWDGNVGARMLFHMCGVFAKNNKLQTGNRIQF